MEIRHKAGFGVGGDGHFWGGRPAGVGEVAPFGWQWGGGTPLEWQWRGCTLGVAGLEARHQLLEEVARVRRGDGRGRLRLAFSV